MSEKRQGQGLSRRRFLTGSALAAGAMALPGSASLLAQDATVDVPRSHNGAGYERRAWKLQPLPMTAVKLRPGPMQTAMEINQRYLHSLPNDRLAYNFRAQAGLATPGTPFGGWEDPKVELRGHFTGGHYLSACALAWASTGDRDLLNKANDLVAALAKCQDASGYLSAFPTEFFARLKNGKPVWAPFYTLHKIMAGHLDMYVHGGNEQALATTEGMARWVAGYLRPIPDAQWRQMQKEEFGGMGEVLRNLYAVTGKEEYLTLGARFDDPAIFDPLAAHEDRLEGLHANTNVPKIIAAARGWELTGEGRYRDIAEFFWETVTSRHAYCTGGTSNDEHWQAAGQLAHDLGPNTEECCVSYNMLKLSRHLHGWSGDAKYMDYYERVLYNARLGTQDPQGRLMYFLSLSPGMWKTFGTLEDSFWCCTGTGVEEYEKTNDSIYWHDGHGMYVNLFVASEARWAEKGIRVVQETSFPEEPGTTLRVETERHAAFPLYVRIPYWATRGVEVAVNGRAVATDTAAGGYARVDREWRNGDRISVKLPMQLHSAAAPGDASLQAAMYGPLVLAARQGDAGLTAENTYGHYGPDDKLPHPAMPQVAAQGEDVASWMTPVEGQALAFTAKTGGGQVDAAPLYRIAGERYSAYWKVS